MNLVGFRAKLFSFLFFPFVSRPKRHWCETTSETRGSDLKAWTSNSFQEEALAGCSCRKCAPRRSWSA